MITMQSNFLHLALHEFNGMYQTHGANCKCYICFLEFHAIKLDCITPIKYGELGVQVKVHRNPDEIFLILLKRRNF